MSGKPLVIVVTGSECTGKTTLAGELAERFQAPHSAEFARAYLDRKAAPLDAADVEAIARGQICIEDEAAAAASRLVVKDTDLVSTVTYSRHYYGACPAWIERAARRRVGHVYLLLHPDVPWLPDGLQRDRPELRQHLHDLFRRELESLMVKVVDVRGSWEERRILAFAAVEDALRAAEPRR